MNNSISEKYAESAIQAFISKFDNVIIDITTAANIHSVTTQTVEEYIKTGLITPEFRIGPAVHPRFRLSYILSLDFKQLQRQMRTIDKEAQDTPPEDIKKNMKADRKAAVNRYENASCLDEAIEACNDINELG